MISARGWQICGQVFGAVFILFMLAPLAVVVLASFTDGGYVRFPPTAFGVRWYLEVFRNQDIMHGFLFSLEIALAVAAISGALGVAAALAMVRWSFPGKNGLLGLLTMPLAVPQVVLALALLQTLAVVQVATSPWGIIGGHLLITMPYVLRLTLTSLHDLDHTMERASYSLGASQWETIRLVTLPLIAPGVVAGVFFAFLLSFDEVTISIFLAIPGKTTLPAQVFAIAATGSDPIITATSGLLIILATAFVLIIERSFGALRLLTGGKVSS